MRSNKSIDSDEYVLITAAYNEGAHIAGTIEAVLLQSAQPRRWLIVSDGSTDDTDKIVLAYRKKNKIVEYVRKDKLEAMPGFVSKVQAIRLGYAALVNTNYQYIGILDADISMDRHYYENVIRKIKMEQRLGIVGGFVHERVGDEFVSRPSNSAHSVAGAIQFFRRECYEEIGGHQAMEYGGEDWLCEIMARKCGWTVTACPGLVVYHHGSGDCKRGAMRDSFRQGKMDYSIGSHPVFELIKCGRRIKEKPVVLRAMLRMCGYVSSVICRDPCAVPEDVVRYVREEQLGRLNMWIRGRV